MTNEDHLRSLVETVEGYGVSSRVAILRSDLRDLLAALDAERERGSELEKRVERLRAGLKLYLCDRDHRQGEWCGGVRAKNALEDDDRAAKEQA